MDKKPFFVRVLTERKELFDEIAQGGGQQGIIINSALVVLFFSAVYGVVMGLFSGGFVIFMDMVKIPFLLLVVLYTSFPSFYVTLALTGRRSSPAQVLALVSLGYAAAAAVLVAFTPIAFVYSVSETSHSTIQMVHYVLFGLAGVAGVYYLGSGLWNVYGERDWKRMEWLVALAVGCVLTLLVGYKMVWLLKPYFHYTSYFFEGLRI